MNLIKIINNLSYHNKIDVNHLLDYSNENNEYLEIQSLKEIMASVIENLVKDEVEDNLVSLPITREEVFIIKKLFTVFCYNLRMQH